MLTRRSLQVYVVAAVVAAVIPLYLWYLQPRADVGSMPGRAVTGVCVLSIAPAAFLCLALPSRYFHDHTSLTPIDGDYSGRHGRIYCPRWLR